MAVELMKCTRCGKLIAAEGGNTLCGACLAERVEQAERIEEAITRWNLQTPEEIATFVGLTADEVRQIIKETSLFRSKVDRRVPCKRCRENMAQPDSDYCLDCRLQLNYELGRAMGELADHIVKMRATMPIIPEAQRKKIVTTMDEIGKRTGSRTRGDFAPKNRYRTQ